MSITKAQKAALTVISNTPAPEVEHAHDLKYLAIENNLTDIVPVIDSYIFKKKTALALKGQAGDAAKDASEQWQMVRGAADKKDDLVSQAEAKALKTETPGARLIRFLQEQYSTVYAFVYTDKATEDVVAELPSTSEDAGTMTLASLVRAAVACVKDKVALPPESDACVVFRAAVFEMLNRIHQKDQPTITSFRAIWKGTGAEAGLRVLHPYVLDLLLGNASVETADPSDLWFAILSVSHWDTALAKPDRVTEIARAYEANKAAPKAEPAAKEPTEVPANVTTLITSDPASREFRLAVSEASISELMEALHSIAEQETSFEELEIGDVEAVLSIVHELTEERKATTIDDNDIVSLVAYCKQPTTMARLEGVKAFKAGAARATNPYKKQAERLAWDQGWAAASEVGD